MTEFKELKLTELVASSTNPRTEFEENSLKELAESIKQHGVLQPIIVRQLPEAVQNGEKDIYELVCGERRYRASILGGVETIPASIRELTDDEVFELQIIENLERKDVHPMDEATAFLKMIESGKYTIEDISAKIAKTETFVAQRLKLNDLIPDLKEEFKKGEFGIGHAVLLARVSEEAQEEIFKDSKNTYRPGYGTVKELKSELENENSDLDKAIFPLMDSQLLPKAGACFKCPKNSKANPVLFAEYEENLCFDRSCFLEKEENFIYQTVDEIIKENPGVILVGNYYSEKHKTVEPLLKEYNKSILTSWDEFEKDGETDAYHVSDLKWVKITLKSKALESISDNPQENIKLEISKIKSKAERALELDREKVMTKINEEIIGNEKNILTTEEYLNEEEIPAFLMALYDKGNWEFRKHIEEVFDIPKGSAWSSTEIYEKLCGFKLSVNDQNKFFRSFIVYNLSSPGTLDYGKSSNAKAIFDYVKNSYNEDVENYILEQNAVAEKRIAKSDARISELMEALNPTEVSVLVSNAKVDAVPSSDFPTFEKITRKKKFSLNNSYFKNCNSQTEPSTPYEVVGYFKQHGELPFDMDPEENPNWIYETYIEYQKRAGVLNSQFFTPPSTAQRIAELADEYFSEVNTEPYVLDACCGFGMLTKPVAEKGFLVQGFDYNSDILKMYSEFTGCVSEQKDINSYLNDDKQWMNIISNPPYEIKELTQFFKLLYDLLDVGGIAILLLPKGFVDKDKPKALVEVLENFSVIHREDMKEGFARTGITAEIVVIER